GAQSRPRRGSDDTPTSARPRKAATPDASRTLAAEAIATLAHSQRMNRLLLESLNEAVWDAAPPGGKGRTIQAITAHVHNVRHMWLVACAPGSRIPAKLERGTVTRKQ